MAKSKIHREDGLLSAQMLNGIPEVDLGINTKLSNIERTEAAKRIMGLCSISLFWTLGQYLQFFIYRSPVNRDPFGNLVRPVFKSAINCHSLYGVRDSTSEKFC